MASTLDEPLRGSAVIVIPAQPQRDDAADDHLGPDSVAEPARDGSSDHELAEAGVPSVVAGAHGDGAHQAAAGSDPGVLESLTSAAAAALGVAPLRARGPQVPAAVQVALQVAVMAAAGDLDDQAEPDTQTAAHTAEVVSTAAFGDAETAALAATAVAYAHAAAAAAEAFVAQAARPRDAVGRARAEAVRSKAAGVKAAARAMATGDLGTARRLTTELGATPVRTQPGGGMPVVSSRSLPRLCDLLEDLDAEVREEWHGVLSEPVMAWLLPEVDSEEDVPPPESAPGPIGLMRDLTIARRVEAVLREEQGRAEEAFDQAPAAMLVAEMDRATGRLGRVLRVNRALSWLTGYTDTELFAADLGQLVHQQDIAAGGSPYRDRTQRWVRADGHEIVVRLRVRPVWCGPDEQPFVVGDIEEVPSPPSRLRRRSTAHRRAAAPRQDGG